MGCQSRDVGKRSDPLPADTSTQMQTSQPVQQPAPVQPLAIKPNMTFAGAQVDSVVMIDSARYRIYLSVSTAIPEGSAISLLEPGARIVAQPMFQLNDEGKIDPTIPRNAQLLRLRKASPRSTFIGKVTLDGEKGWLIVSVES